jgi:hypothetical protein
MEPTTPAPPRFQIASRLGIFRDSANLPDPFGTGATFTIHRHGSSAQKAWFRDQVDNDPQTLLQFELMLSSDVSVLLPDEEKAVEAQRAKDKDHPLLPIVDRLTLAASERTLRRDATRKMLASGQMHLSDFMMLDREKDRLKEAIFLLKGWSAMPDADGAAIPFSEESARALLTCDSPLDGAGLDELLLSVDAWTFDFTGTVPTKEELPAKARVTKEDEKGVHFAVKHVIPGLTLGTAYQLFFIQKAREVALFRDQAIGEAAKNLPPSSGLTSSSGDGSARTGA